MNHELFPENETCAVFAMKRAWSIQPEEWTLLITINDSLMVECIQQTGEVHVTVGAEQVFLFSGSEPAYSLLIQTNNETQLQFMLSKQLFETIYHLVKDHITPVPPYFLPSCCDQEGVPEATLENFFSLALDTCLDDAQDNTTVPAEPVLCNRF